MDKFTLAIGSWDIVSELRYMWSLQIRRPWFRRQGQCDTSRQRVFFVHILTVGRRTRSLMNGDKCILEDRR